MKLSAFVAIAAVIGGTFLIPNPAEAGHSCQGLSTAAESECWKRFLRSNRLDQSPRVSASSGRCPAGTSYHKIKSGGLLFKRTVAEGCYSDFQASQLRMQANSSQRQRQRDFQRDIQEATRGPVNCSGTVNSWGNGYATYNTNCY